MSKILAAALAALLAAPPAADTALIVHALNRMAFGPAAGDVERLRAIGLDRYIDEQLHPERIDDEQMRERLVPLETLSLTSSELASRVERRGPEARKVIVELAQQKLLRAVYSERQLQEVLVDFWFNHFNVDARKGADRFLIAEYERDVIRPHVLGSFRELLGATAKSPAMLFYLDNWISVDPDAPAPRAQREPARRKGLNENYARELLELHTLGVDGGYSQKDVTEVARAFTGWTIDRPRQGGGYRFAARLHDEGSKVVLGRALARGGGERDGERVLDILAEHPSTAMFIARKLVRRFVSDTPPPALVERVAARFRDTHGNLREVVRAILVSKEFRAPEARNAKAKTPFEFLASALRVTGGNVDARLVRTMSDLGMPLYQCQPPTGYADTADAWINTGALVARMNVASRLAGRDEQLALGLGSPEFQRR